MRSTAFIEARAMYRADGPEEMRPVGEVEVTVVVGARAAAPSGDLAPGMNIWPDSGGRAPR